MSSRSTPPSWNSDENYGRNIGFTSVEELTPVCGCLCCVASLLPRCPCGCASKTQCLCIYVDLSLCLVSTHGGECFQFCASQARCVSVPSFQQHCQACCLDTRCGSSSAVDVPSLVTCCFRTVYFEGVCGSHRCCATVRDLEISRETTSSTLRAAPLTSDSVDTQGDTHETQTGSDSPSSQPVRDLAPPERRAPRVIILPLTLSEMSQDSGASTPAVMSPGTSELMLSPLNTCEERNHGYYP